MRYIGFSTGALARGDFRRGLSMLENKSVQIVELSALRQNELLPLVEQLDDLELDSFQYISFHAPSLIDPEFEPAALLLLERVQARGWPIIVHPDAIHNVQEWSRFGDQLCIENMDKRKPIGQTATDLEAIFDQLPDASFCFDLGHVRQIDPTMSEAVVMLTRFKTKLKQLHVSEVNSQSKHDPLTLEAIMAFQRVSAMIPQGTPIILESHVLESQIESEIANALSALNPANLLAFAGD
ncbi:MAG: hypothetical protein WCG81_16310 [Candidatus Angelobacter sp.]